MMNPIARRLLGAAAAAVARKLLPDAAPDDPGSALALRSDMAMAPPDRTNLFPTARPEILHAPPLSAVQLVAAPAPLARIRRVTVTETITVEEREW